MWRPKSFASSLVVPVLVHFALIQIALCALILFVRAGEIRDDFDERLSLRAVSSLHALEAAYLRAGALTPSERSGSLAGGLTLSGVYWQLRDRAGEVIQRSTNLGAATIPYPANASADSDSPTITTWRDGEASAVLGRPGALRVLTLRSALAGVEPFTLQVARDLEPVHTTLARLERILVLAFLLGLALNGLAAWDIGRRIRRGILSITRQAESITGGESPRRIAPGGSESELRQLAASLNTMLDGLERAMRSREQFLADVSHELKAPLTALAAEARMMSAASRTSDLCRQLDTAVQSVVSSVTGTADALLMLAKCSDGAGGPHAATLSLNEIVTDAVAKCLAFARPRSVRLIPMLPDQEELLVEGHADLLRVMLENVVRNAVEHSPQGAPVHIALAREDGDARILVSDTGPGVPPDMLSRVFDRFVTGRTRDAGGSGHGLGLAIGRRVVELHRGSIVLENRPAGGCEVRVRLPLAHAAVSPPA